MACLIFEYVTRDAEHGVTRLKYSYHWQNAGGDLLKRWDNVKHHPHLANAPHHVHLSDGSVSEDAETPDLIRLLSAIESCLRTGGEL